MKPTPKEIKTARILAGLTQEQAASLAGLGSRERWAEYERGARDMPEMRWKMFKLELQNKRPP